MLATVGTWLLMTLLPMIAEFIFLKVCLPGISRIISDIFITVVIQGGFTDYNGLGSFFNDLVGADVLSNAIMAIALVVLALNVIAEGLKLMTAPVTGKDTPSPYAFISRCVLTAVLILAYPYIISYVIQLLNAIKDMPLFNLSNVKASFADGIQEMKSLNIGVEGNDIIDMLVGIILCVTLLKEMLYATMIYVERYLSFCLFILLGPICIAFYPNEDQKGLLKSWLTGLVTQMMVILLSIFALFLFTQQMSKLGSSGAIGKTEIAQFVCALGILELVKNSEQLINMLGLKTIPSGDSARMFTSALVGTTLMAREALHGGAGKLGLAVAQNTRFASSSISMAPGFTGGKGYQSGKGYQDPVKSTSKTLLDNFKAKNGRMPTEKEMKKLSNKATGKGFVEQFKERMGGESAEKKMSGLRYTDRDNLLNEMKTQVAGMKKEANTLKEGATPSGKAVLALRGNNQGYEAVGKARELTNIKGAPEKDAQGNFYRQFAVAIKKQGESDDKAQVGIVSSFGHYDENHNWVTATDPNAKENLAKMNQAAKEHGYSFAMGDNLKEAGINQDKNARVQQLSGIAAQTLKDGKEDGTAYNLNDAKDAAVFKEKCQEKMNAQGLNTVDFKADVKNTIGADDSDGGIQILGSTFQKMDQNGENGELTSQSLKIGKDGISVTTDKYTADAGGSSFTGIVDPTTGNVEMKENVKYSRNTDDNNEMSFAKFGEMYNDSAKEAAIKSIKTGKSIEECAGGDDTVTQLANDYVKEGKGLMEQSFKTGEAVFAHDDNNVSQVAYAYKQEVADAVSSSIKTGKDVSAFTENKELADIANGYKQEINNVVATSLETGQDISTLTDKQGIANFANTYKQEVNDAIAASIQTGQDISTITDNLGAVELANNRIGSVSLDINSRLEKGEDLSKYVPSDETAKIIVNHIETKGQEIYQESIKNGEDITITQASNGLNPDKATIKPHLAESSNDEKIDESLNSVWNQLGIDDETSELDKAIMNRANLLNQEDEKEQYRKKAKKIRTIFTGHSSEDKK